ncbi:MAG: fructose-6-phosphate aldolase [Planctomycetes bacterium GWF2_42_9]|nr:MAG: fructose-6-phosphate aldolase [Planctomycetes bacterium GWF2_42_9]
MQIFLDTANIAEIKKSLATGVVSGVTTNPSIISRENKPFDTCIAEIIAVDPNLTVLLEVLAMDTQGMISEARKLNNISNNIVVKIPMTPEGLAAVKVLSQEGIKTTVTLVFSLNQAIAASCVGADYVAPFIGRLEDIDTDGTELVNTIKRTFETQKNKTKIIVASIRTPKAVSTLFSIGCDIITMPLNILEGMFKHPLTDAGLKKFNEDWQKVPAK